MEALLFPCIFALYSFKILRLKSYTKLKYFEEKFTSFIVHKTDHIHLEILIEKLSFPRTDGAHHTHTKTIIQNIKKK